MWWFLGSHMTPPDTAVVPPTMSDFSRTSTSAPPSEARVAAVSAAPPDPTTTTSTTRSHAAGIVSVTSRPLFPIAGRHRRAHSGGQDGDAVVAVDEPRRLAHRCAVRARETEVVGRGEAVVEGAEQLHAADRLHPVLDGVGFDRVILLDGQLEQLDRPVVSADEQDVVAQAGHREESLCRDRKSTRLNSSHPSISYAVFCLKKKKHASLEAHRPSIAIKVEYLHNLTTYWTTVFPLVAGVRPPPRAGPRCCAQTCSAVQ